MSSHVIRLEFSSELGARSDENVKLTSRESELIRIELFHGMATRKSEFRFLDFSALFRLIMQGLFLSILPKTQFPKNARTQFENDKALFEKAQKLNLETAKIGNFMQVTNINSIPSINFGATSRKSFKNHIFKHECHEKPI